MFFTRDFTNSIRKFSQPVGPFNSTLCTDCTPKNISNERSISIGANALGSSFNNTPTAYWHRRQRQRQRSRQKQWEWRRCRPLHSNTAPCNCALLIIYASPTLCVVGERSARAALRVVVTWHFGCSVCSVAAKCKYYIHQRVLIFLLRCWVVESTNASANEWIYGWRPSVSQLARQWSSAEPGTKSLQSVAFRIYNELVVHT